MTIPLSKLLTDLLTDPAGRAALGDDPAGVLADNGWEDLTPRDMGDALRLVTASGPAAAAHAGSELPEQPSSFAEVVGPVLEATAELDSWDADPVAPLVAGAIEPETYDFAPPPLVGVDPELAADPHDDPFLRGDAEQAAATPETGEEPTDELIETIGLSFDGEADLQEPAPSADYDDLGADDGMTLREAPGMDIADDLALPEDDPADADDLDLSWGDTDATEEVTAEAVTPQTPVTDAVDDLDPFVEVVEDVDAVDELDQGGPDQFDDLD